MDDKATGILRRRDRDDGDDLVVAELTVKPKPTGDTRMLNEADLLVFRSGEWRSIRTMPIGHASSSSPSTRWPWKTDMVVPVGDRLLCWVDLYHGFIFSDVFDDNPRLQYVPLPEPPAMDTEGEPRCDSDSDDDDAATLDAATAKGSTPMTTPVLTVAVAGGETSMMTTTATTLAVMSPVDGLDTVGRTPTSGTSARARHAPVTVTTATTGDATAAATREVHATTRGTSTTTAVATHLPCSASLFLRQSWLLLSCRRHQEPVQGGRFPLSLRYAAAASVGLKHGPRTKRR
ncbi:uncharacterized protein LOC127755407 [Oryza glaberrima]|uniref:uncharacterized protein LOC127755407 n=1 Tax=Oryza glaberrima TaxID=4538 RepID=UPI00224C46DD|nr:uncharacterized protein LOC127755407 [Oryza glaberrima]